MINCEIIYHGTLSCHVNLQLDGDASCRSKLVHTETTKSHLDGEHGDALRAVDAVPDAEVPPVLGDHHIAARHPLDVGAETQHRRLHAGPYVVQMELRGKGGGDLYKIFCSFHHRKLFCFFLRVR